MIYLMELVQLSWTSKSLGQNNRRVKRHQRQQTRDILTLKDILDYEISSSREIVNDYDVCDYKFDYRFLTPFMKRHGSYGEYAKKVLRK